MTAVHGCATNVHLGFLEGITELMGAGSLLCSEFTEVEGAGEAK